MKLQLLTLFPRSLLTNFARSCIKSTLSLTIDASNTKKVKLVSIMVCYSLPEIAVKVKLLEFKSVLGETAEILSE